MLGLYQILLLVIITSPNFESALGKPFKLAKLKPKLEAYLKRYGYLPQQQRQFPWRTAWDKPSGRQPEGDSDQGFEQAVRKLQVVMNLPVTGHVTDKEVEKIINKKRCGMKDIRGGKQRTKRYALHGTVWNKKQLTYKIVNFPLELNRTDVERTVHKALMMWSNVSQLTFKRVITPNVEADINIKFVVGYHGDDRPTDGPGKELAHAFFPLNNTGLAGDLHFDSEETFTVTGGDGVDLLWLLVHELGHSLGLEHSFHPDTVMFPYYTGYDPDLQLNEDDINGIQHLYGKPKPVSSPPPSAPATTTSPSPLPDRCSIQSIDTTVRTQDLSVYAFSGPYFWRLKNSGSQVMRIKHHWPGLENDLDAAFTRRRDGKTFFFKGSKFWIFINKALYKGPLDVAQLSFGSQLHNLDAAFELSGETYLFKGDKYWHYNWSNKSPGNAKMIPNAWNGVLTDMDAAFPWKRGKVIFIKGHEYYRLNQKRLRSGKKGFPKNFFHRWMGCSSVLNLRKND